MIKRKKERQAKPAKEVVLTPEREKAIGEMLKLQKKQKNVDAKIKRRYNEHKVLNEV